MRTICDNVPARNYSPDMLTTHSQPGESVPSLQEFLSFRGQPVDTLRGIQEQGVVRTDGQIGKPRTWEPLNDQVPGNLRGPESSPGGAAAWRRGPARKPGCATRWPRAGKLCA